MGGRVRATCWNPRVKGLTLMVNSLFNGWRMEDVWLDQRIFKGQRAMKRNQRRLSAAAWLLAAMAAAAPAVAQVAAHRYGDLLGKVAVGDRDRDLGDIANL